jgi:two-component system phosphate regulon sensor histidine kinase PhoR
MTDGIFKRITDLSPCGILIYDNRIGEVVYTNQTFRDWGILKTEFVEKLLKDKPREIEFKGRFYSVKTVSDGDKLAFILEDITPLKTYQRAKKDFVANVSHELKTPISVIQSIAETLYMEEEDPIKKRFLNRILKRTAEMEALVEDLLVLAALESKEGKVLWEKVNLRSVVDEIIQNLKGFAQEKRVEIINEIPEGFTCLCDGHKIGILLRNLIENAVKYNREGGKVFVRAKREKDGTVTVEVEDTGIGIPKKYLPLIFERFYRVDKSRSREIRGTGLGLSIVKHIALIHGGTVEVESEEGKGSLFRVKIPPKGRQN